MTPKQIGFLTFAGFALVALLTLSGKMIEVNDAGHIDVVQGAGGDMKVVTAPGPYMQNFGKITVYPRSVDYTFCEEDCDLKPIEVQFNDSATAEVSGNVRIVLPSGTDDMLAIHQTYKGPESLLQTTIPNLLSAALSNTANLMKAEETYAARRSEFQATAQKMLQKGLFEARSRDVHRPNSEGGEFTERVVELVLDEKTGQPIVSQASPLDQFHIQVLNLSVKKFDYDPKTKALIETRKETEQQRVTARSQAETAKQNTITAEEQGKANIAKERAAKEVEKIAAVTEAEKARDVARLAKEQTELESQAALIKARAEAEGNKFKVAAGLTPEQRAQFQKDTAIGVAQALSGAKFPSVFVAGGTGAHTNPLEAMGYEAMYDLSKKMAGTKE